jgi:predicted transcriptional regulator
MIDRTYFRFLAHSGPINLGVDRVAGALLDEICLCDVEPLTVTEAMSLVAIASPATIHRKIDELLAAGLIEHKQEGDNRRTKFLVPTMKALDHYARLGAAIREAVK